MAWKNFPYWLRGGIIGLIMGVIISPLYVISTPIPYFYKITYYLYYPISLSIINKGPFSGTSILLLIFLVLVITGIYGAIIGFIYGKTKGREVQNT